MTRLRRRLLLAAIAALVLALLAGSAFYSTTRRALERAEAFRFRRMLVNRQGEEGAYRFFFVTNREADPAIDDPVERFGRERDTRLSYGRFDTEIAPSLGIGMLIDPSDWFQNEEIRLRDVRALERDAFVDELRRQVERSPHRSLLVNVNGFRERFGSALRKTAFVGHVLDIDSPLLVFDWPGDQGSTIRGYQRAQERARASGADLAHTLAAIVREVRPERLWLLANSMGAEVVVHAFAALYADPEFADLEREIDAVILTAPDVDRGAFDERFEDEMGALAETLTVYVSSNDRALLMSRILNRGARLGESTIGIGPEGSERSPSEIDPDNPDQSAAAAGAFSLVEAGSRRVTVVDVTPVNRTRNFHNFSLETPEFFDDVFLRLVNADAPESRLLYRVRTRDGRVYWVLTPGR